MFYSTRYVSPLGEITIICNGDSLVGLWFEGHKCFNTTLSAATVAKADIPVLQDAREWLDSYFAGQQPAISMLPLAPVGSTFRQSVWRIICEIPYGGVMTYGEVAKQIAAARGVERMSAQAVGGAVGSNPISIIIPCHRVIGKKGNLTGYGGGIEKKIALLKLEQAYRDNFYRPKQRSVKSRHGETVCLQ